MSSAHRSLPYRNCPLTLGVPSTRRRLSPTPPVVRSTTLMLTPSAPSRRHRDLAPPMGAGAGPPAGGAPRVVPPAQYSRYRDSRAGPRPPPDDLPRRDGGRPEESSTPARLRDRPPPRPAP